MAAMATAGLPSFDRAFLPIISAALANYAQDEFLRFGNAAYSYAAVDELSSQIANRLIETGFRPGMKGAVYSLNSAISFIATLGILRAGGIWIPINPLNSAAENVRVLGQFDCEAVFFQTAYSQPIAEFVKTATSCGCVVCLDDFSPPHQALSVWSATAAATSPEIHREPTDLISIPLTGGTTGTPKGVMLSNRNFCALDYASRHMFQDRKPVILCAAPMTHVSGRIALTAMSSGARCVILERVDPQLVLATIAEQRITDFFLPPTAIYALLDQPNVQDFDYSSLRTISYGSAPMFTQRLKDALRTFGPVMRGGYGQTEAPMFIARLRPEEHFVNDDVSTEIAPDERLRSVGRSTLISTIGILDENQHELPAGQTGEIAVRGPMVSEGYYQEPQATAKVRVNGWHLTGDIGYLDEPGYLYIVDRKKDMIISGGFNVYSTEVERALLQIEGVQLAAVIGVPDNRWGEAVAAFVQLAPDSTLTADAIIAFAKSTLGSVKAPKHVTCVDDLPRTPVGKVDKKRLREAAWASEDRRI
jgi:acyl-CoA synthetase (AMP-forming)/AMP-acid ligase II